MYVDKKKKNARIQLERFFKEEMLINPKIDDFYFLGEKDPCNIVLTFASMADKRAVFANIERIKNLGEQGWR